METVEHQNYADNNLFDQVQDGQSWKGVHFYKECSKQFSIIVKISVNLYIYVKMFLLGSWV
jgi:hypothetical protein